ncbi:MAG: hypothetical protein WBE40_07285 [Thermoplasmata archaeon]
MAVIASFLMVFVVPAGIAAASSPALTPGPSYTLWAYGAVRTVNFAGSSGEGFSYKGTATYGYSVILNQTNLSTQTFQLSVNRTMGAAVSVEYCSPNCRSPSVTATVSHRVWESMDAVANFTTAGVVSENGQNVSAIALTSSHTVMLGNLTDQSSGPLRSSYLSTEVSAVASVNFATPLGLLPNDLTAPLNWSATSAFTASGAYAIQFLYSYIGPHTSTSYGPHTTTGVVARSGNVSVTGSTRAGPGGTVDFDGVPYLNVSLSVQGPFDAREGFILVPQAVDLFYSASEGPWSANETGGASAQMTSLYARPEVGSHLGIGGSEWVYAASAVNPTVTSVTPLASGVTEIAADSNDVGSTPVQGVPIGVAQAHGYQGCLVSDSGCPSATSALLPLIAVGVLIVLVTAIVASVIVVERRRVPPPSYPNAGLYPPGGPARAAPVPRAGAPVTPPPPPAEDDPLSNLW